MVKGTQTEKLSQMIELLSPLTSEERQRLVRASLTFLGDDIGAAETRSAGADSIGSDDDAELSARARSWLKQSGLAVEHLQQVFHVANGRAEVIASVIPGASGKERTVNAYVLTGLAGYIAGGELKFDDKAARSVCMTSGCYDQTNHATYLKARGNLFTGSKNSGWALTAPGLKHAADLVRTLT